MTNEEEIEEIMSEMNCPICGYPLVIECGLEVCYHCGWYKGDTNNDSSI